MSSTLGRILRVLARGDSTPLSVLDGFVDSLIQSFENCRPGLTDETLAGGPSSVTAFFADLYEKEIPRLTDAIRVGEPGLSPAAREELRRKVDDLVRKVVLPAYVRLAGRFTRRERNGFYLLPEPLHGVERLAWSVAGMALGGFAVWAPFIPVWEKYWILPFAVGGFFFPDLRRLLGFRHYEGELDALVNRTNREITRIDTAYLTDGEALEERALPKEAGRRRDAQRAAEREGGS